VAAGLVMIGMLIVSGVFIERPLWRRVSTALLAWTLIGMVAGRETVRQISFDRDFHVTQLASSTQHGALALFVLLLTAGVAVLAWLGWLVWKLPRNAASQ
jgi:NhaP-type Na+/H+ and K+/H+ antiporter